jgi:hypothetical protein
MVTIAMVTSSTVNEFVGAMVVSGAINEHGGTMVVILVNGMVDELGSAIVMSNVINESFGDKIASLEHSTPINIFLFSHLAATGFLPVLIDKELENNASIANEHRLKN